MTRVDLPTIRKMWAYVSPLDATDSELSTIGAKLVDNHPNMTDDDYRYNLAVRLSDYAHKQRALRNQ